MKKSLTRWFIVGTTVMAIAAVVGIAIGATASESDAIDLAILEAPPSLDADVPDRIGDVPFGDIHSRVALDQRRLARVTGGRSVFVAPSTVRADEACLLIVAPSGAAVSTCNGPSVIDDYGAIPHLEFASDQSIDVTAIVPDGITVARADDGTRGSIVNNVLSMRVGPAVNSIELVSASGGSNDLNVGIWRDPPLE